MRAFIFCLLVAAVFADSVREKKSPSPSSSDKSRLNPRSVHSEHNADITIENENERQRERRDIEGDNEHDIEHGRERRDVDRDFESVHRQKRDAYPEGEHKTDRREVYPDSDLKTDKKRRAVGGERRLECRQMDTEGRRLDCREIESETEGRVERRSVDTESEHHKERRGVSETEQFDRENERQINRRESSSYPSESERERRDVNNKRRLEKRASYDLECHQVDGEGHLECRQIDTRRERRDVNIDNNREYNVNPSEEGKHRGVYERDVPVDSPTSSEKMRRSSPFEDYVKKQTVGTGRTMRHVVVPSFGYGYAPFSPLVGGMGGFGYFPGFTGGYFRGRRSVQESSPEQTQRQRRHIVTDYSDSIPLMPNHPLMEEMVPGVGAPFGVPMGNPMLNGMGGMGGMGGVL